MKFIDYALAVMFTACAAFAISPTLGYTCIDGVNGSGCYPGHVRFQGSGFPSLVHVVVTRNSDGAKYDDYDYNAPAGNLDFTQTLYPSGAYTVTVTDQTGTFTQLQLTTGGQ